MDTVAAYGWGLKHATYPEDFHRDYDRFRSHRLPDNGMMLSEDADVSDHIRATHFWLLFPCGTPVGFCRTLYYSNRDTHRLVLGDIEIREQYRGGGLAHEFTDAIRNYYGGETLWTTGSFTPDGAHALSFLPLIPSHKPPVVFGAMTFVLDWNNLVEKYPL